LNRPDWFEAWGLDVLLTLGLSILLTVPLHLLTRRLHRRLRKAATRTEGASLQRTGTLASALATSGIVITWIIAILVVLDKLGVPLAPLFASAGIAGVALGFGAQSIVRDALSGVFILLENQFSVGDFVELHTSAAPVGGKVETLTLRVTSLRAFDGTLHTVPNGNIQLVSNKSKGWARAIVDIRLAYGEDVDHVRALLGELFESLRSDAFAGQWIREGPSVLGLETMGDYALVLRVTAETLPSRSAQVERILRERIASRLEAEGIRTPLPPAIVSSRGASE
jgi:moderate conductance mechanosensitive channel